MYFKKVVLDRTNAYIPGIALLVVSSLPSSSRYPFLQDLWHRHQEEMPLKPSERPNPDLSPTPGQPSVKRSGPLPPQETKKLPNSQETDLMSPPRKALFT